MTISPATLCAKASPTPQARTIEEAYETLLARIATQHTAYSESRLAPVYFDSPEKIVALVEEKPSMTNTIISRELLIWLTLLDPESGVKVGLEQASLFLHKPERRIYQLTSSVLYNLAFMVLLHDPHKESEDCDLLASGVAGLRKRYSNRSSLKSYLNEYLSDLGL